MKVHVYLETERARTLWDVFVEPAKNVLIHAGTMAKVSQWSDYGHLRVSPFKDILLFYFA